MNKSRRNHIQKIIPFVENIKNELETILDDEREAYDNMPESLQMSTNGEISEDAQDNLESAIEALEDVMSCLEEIVV